MFTKRLIITNNPKVYDRYRGKVDVDYIEEAAPYEIYSRAAALLKKGARLIKPKIYSPMSFYSTVCLFFGDENAPSRGNIREIENAMKLTYKLSRSHKEPLFTPPFAVNAQLADYRASKIEIYDDDHGRSYTAVEPEKGQVEKTYAA